MPFNREDLHPTLDRELDKIIAEVKEKTGYAIKPCQGLRTFAEQNALYAQGRTRKGPIVTNARAGYSAHNFGCAVDFCLAQPEEGINARGQLGTKTVFPDYTLLNGKVVEHPVWRALAEAAERRGFVSGYTWKRQDKPHVQIGDNVFYSSGQALQLFRRHGKQAVWAEAERQRQARLKKGKPSAT